MIKSAKILLGASSGIITFEYYRRHTAAAEQKKPAGCSEEVDESFIQLGKLKEQVPCEGKDFIATHHGIKSHKIIYDRKYKRLVPKLFRVIHQIKEETGSPGISFAISKNGEMVIKGGIGFSDVENGVLMTSETILRIASISKSLTSIAIGRLLEEGKLDLDKPIQTYLKDYGQKTFEGKPVTITTKQLLSHTSGIRGYFKDPEEFDPKKSDMKKKDKLRHDILVSKFNKEQAKKKWDENLVNKHYDTVQDGLCLFEKDPLIYEPGIDWEYSSVAYSLVSRIIEVAAGKDYVTYLKRICKDLGMSNTVVDLNDPIVCDRSRNYNREEKKHRLQNVPYVDNSYKWSGGGFLSNVEDLVIFGNEMLRSYSTTEGVLKPSTVSLLWKPITDCNEERPNYHYALGWYVTSPEMLMSTKKYDVQHTGGAIGASSVLYIQPNMLPTDIDNTSINMKDSTDMADGVVIVLIVNMQSIGLLKTAEKLSDIINENT